MRINNGEKNWVNTESWNTVPFFCIKSPSASSGLKANMIHGRPWSGMTFLFLHDKRPGIPHWVVLTMGEHNNK